MTQHPMIQTPNPKISEPLHVDTNNFVPSLLNEGVRIGTLTEEEADTIRAGILDLMAQSILSVSGGSSTSVKEETAKTLLDNILFHIEASLKSTADLHSALLRLKGEDLRKIYTDGVGMAHKALNEACELWESMRKALRPDMDMHYKQLVLHSLSSYLGSYDYKHEPKTEFAIYLPTVGIDCRLCGIYTVLSAMRTLSDLFSE